MSTITDKFSTVYEDRDGDKILVMSNNQLDPSDGDLYFVTDEHGVVLKREQALDLAARITAYFTTN